MAKPIFSSVLDLGLRDVGVANRPRRFAAHVGRGLVPMIAAAVLYAVVACLLIRSVRVPALLVVLAWPAIMLGPGLRMMSRAPVLVLKVDAEGRNQVIWVLVAPYVLVVPALLLSWDPLGVPVAVIAALTVARLWRVRDRVPAGVRRLRSALAAGEPVLGDGVGAAKGSARGRDALRVLAATDRRLLAAGRSGLRLDLPYEAIGFFGIEWTLGGRVGTLTLEGGGAVHRIGAIAPSNLLSIAEALRAHGVPTTDGAAIDDARRGWEEALVRGAGRRRSRIGAVVLASLAGLLVTATASGYDLMTLPVAYQQLTGDRLPVDGRSDLTGGSASLRYTPQPGLHELRTDEHWGEAPDDGARWELRSSFTRGQNSLSLSHYVFVPRLGTPDAVAHFVAGKDVEHSRIAGSWIFHREQVFDGRTGYVWEYRSRRGYWQYAAWFPGPVDSVRVECVAKKDAARFKRLCAEAMASLRFRR